MAGRKLPAELAARGLECLAAGMNPSRATGVAKSSCYSLDRECSGGASRLAARAAGRPGRGIAPEKARELLGLVASGLSANQAARAAGMPKTFAYGLVKKWAGCAPILSLSVTARVTGPARSACPECGAESLAEAVERAVSRHRQHLNAAVPEQAAAPAPAPPLPQEPPPEARRPGGSPTGPRPGTPRCAGCWPRAATTGRSAPPSACPATRSAASPAPPASRSSSSNDGTGRRASILDEHAEYLAERWNAGCTNAAQLHQELRDRSYRGGSSYVRQYLARYRGTTAAPAPAPGPPKVRAVTAWIMTRPDRLADSDKASLDAILAASPGLAAVAAAVRAFAVITDERRGRSGAVEGHVNRIIMWNQICQISRAWACRTSMIGRLTAPGGRSSCRGVGPAGVGVSASRSSSRSRAALPSSTAACSSSVSGITARILCRFCFASRIWALLVS